MNTRLHRSRRNRLVERQGGKCFYCKIEMTDADGISPTSATIDHRVPRALGGPDSLHNYVACCLKCNLDKADEMPDLPPKKINKNVRKKVKKPADAHIQAERAARKMAERRSLAR